MAFYFGNRVRLTSTFTNFDGQPFDPKSFTLLVMVGGKRTVYTPGMLVRTDVGAYYLDLVLNFVGNVSFAWSSTASGEEVAEEGSFLVSTRKVI